MQTGIIRDNVGNDKEVILNLKKGDILIAIGKLTLKGDIGCSGHTYDYEAFEIGKEYPVDHTYNWSGKNVSYVLDSDNCCVMATPKLFKLKE